MNLSELLRQAPDDRTLNLWLARIPYAAYLGLRAQVHGQQILFTMPRNDKLVGNPTLPALHGGTVGAFMELAGSFHLLARMEKPSIPKIIDFSLDYLRPARLRDTYAECTLTRQGRNIANVSISAWQTTPDEPNAIARAHFLLSDYD